MKSVAIIGGGITGLTAAFQLQRKNIPVTLYESGARVGGVIRSLRENGYLAEFGPNTLMETSPRIAELIRDLDLEGRRIYSAPAAERRYIVRGRRPVSLPASPMGFAATPLFSLGAKLRLFAEPFIKRAPAGAEESVGAFVLRRLGREFLDYAINPLVAGVYAGDPNRLSVPHAFPKLHALEQRYGSLILGQILGGRERKRRAEVSKQFAKKLSFDQGLEVLTETLGLRLGANVRLQTTVTGVRERSGEWALDLRQGEQSESATHSAVLFAGPAYRLPEMNLAFANPVEVKPLGEITYPPVASIVLGFKREDVAHPLDGFGMLIPAVERFHILGTIFSSALFPNRAPAGHVTLTSYIGGMRAPELALLDPKDQVKLALEDLRILLGVRANPVFEHTVLYRRAIPQYDVGYGRFKDLMTQIEAKAPGFFLAGHFRDGISLGDSIVSGYSVADRIARFVEQPGRASS